MVTPDTEESGTSNLDGGSQPLAVVLESLNFLVLARVEGGELQIRGIPPSWASDVFSGDVSSAVSESAFLSHFIEMVAYPLWDGPPSALVNSGVWAEEILPAGNPQHFEAFAIHAQDGGQLLAIRKLGGDFEELQLLTQRANENALEHRQLQRETQKKDVLLKCIVHDLNNPLSAVLLNLQILAARSDKNLKASAELALEAARRQANLIKSITEVFSSDLSRLGRDKACAESVSTLVKAAEQVVRTHLNEAMRRNVSISLEDGLTEVITADREVRAEVEPFQRALENLVLNALRYAPRDSTVTVRLEANGAGIRVQVDDAGPGVEPELVTTLFDPFTQGSANGGSMGLGLYFCRMTVEQWNGTLAYERVAGGGARFVFSLPWALHKEAKTNVC